MDGFEPHGTIYSAGTVALTSAVYMLGGGWDRGVPGVVGSWVGREGCYTGYQPSTIPGPIFNIFLRLGPTYGQMKAILRLLMRFPR